MAKARLVKFQLLIRRDLMDPPPLVRSFRSVASTALEILETRLTLALVELREAQTALLKSLMLGGLAVGCCTLTLMFLAGLVIATFWDSHRVLAAAGVAGVFALLSAWLAWLATRQLRDLATLFAATRLELTKDREALNRGG